MVEYTTCIIWFTTIVNNYDYDGYDMLWPWNTKNQWMRIMTQPGRSVIGDPPPNKKHRTATNYNWLVVLTLLKNDGVSQWEGWHPIYEMEHETCSKPPTSYKHMEIDGNSDKQKLLRPVWLILPPHFIMLQAQFLLVTLQSFHIAYGSKHFFRRYLNLYC